MNTVGAMACTAGIAHTYIVKEKLKQAVQELGCTHRIETQGGIGAGEQLTPRETEAVDVIILVIDVKISGENRFKGKLVVRISMRKAVKNTGALLQGVEKALAKKKSGGD